MFHFFSNYKPNYFQRKLYYLFNIINNDKGQLEHISGAPEPRWFRPRYAPVVIIDRNIELLI